MKKAKAGEEQAARDEAAGLLAAEKAAETALAKAVSHAAMGGGESSTAIKPVPTYQNN